MSFLSFPATWPPLSEYWEMLCPGRLRKGLASIPLVFVHGSIREGKRSSPAGQRKETQPLAKVIRESVKGKGDL